MLVVTLKRMNFGGCGLLVVWILRPRAAPSRFTIGKIRGSTLLGTNDQALNSNLTCLAARYADGFLVGVSSPKLFLMI